MHKLPHHSRCKVLLNHQRRCWNPLYSNSDVGERPQFLQHSAKLMCRRLLRHVAQHLCVQLAHRGCVSLVNDAVGLVAQLPGSQRQAAGIS